MVWGRGDVRNWNVIRIRTTTTAQTHGDERTRRGPLGAPPPRSNPCQRPRLSPLFATGLPSSHRCSPNDMRRVGGPGRCGILRVRPATEPGTRRGQQAGPKKQAKDAAKKRAKGAGRRIGGGGGPGG